MIRPKFYGERDILVAEGGSLIVAREVPSVGAFQLDRRFWGDETSLYGVGLALLQEAELQGPRNLCPPPSLSREEGCARRRDSRLPCACGRGRRVPGVVARGSLTCREAADTVSLTSPLTAWCCAPGGKGVSEEGGRE